MTLKPTIRRQEIKTGNYLLLSSYFLKTETLTWNILLPIFIMKHVSFAIGLKYHHPFLPMCLPRKHCHCPSWTHSKSRSWPAFPLSETRNCRKWTIPQLKQSMCYSKYGEGIFYGVKGSISDLLEDLGWEWPSPQVSLQGTTSSGNSAASGRMGAPLTFKGPSAHTLHWSSGDYTGSLVKAC